MKHSKLKCNADRKLKLVLKEMPALKYLDASFTQLHHLEANTFHHNTVSKKNHSLAQYTVSKRQG